MTNKAKRYTDHEIQSLIQGFETQQVSKTEWTHAAHLVVAIWYSSKYDEKEALDRVRHLIIKHNEAVGTINSDSSGYHETITRFWLRTARQFLATHRFDKLTTATNAFIQSQYGQSDWILNFYTKADLSSPAFRLDSSIAIKK